MRPARGALQPRRGRRISRLGLVFAAAAALLLAGCAPGADGPAVEPASPAPSASSEAGGALHGSLTVFAAASLTDSFNDLARAFERAHPQVTVKPIDYDGSSTLAQQLIQGARADVFASADFTDIDEVARAGDLDGPVRAFASNVLEIAAQPGNPRHIRSLADLADQALDVVVCAPQVPCGAAAVKLLALEKVRLHPASQEQNVTAVLTKVELGEADAGLVYVTDVASAGSRVQGVPIRGAARVTNRYGIGVPATAQEPALGRAFVAFVLGPQGRRVLHRYGFGAP